MSTLVELAAEIVSSHASTSAMTSDQLLQEIQNVYASLQALETGKAATVLTEEAKPAISVKQAFKKDEVICMVCGKGGMKTLTRHLRTAHDLKPAQYRKQFNVPAKQSLSARSFSESRRQMALDRGLADNLAKAREIRAAKIRDKKSAPSKVAPAKPAVPVEAAPAKATAPAKAPAAAKPVKAVRPNKPSKPKAVSKNKK